MHDFYPFKTIKVHCIYPFNFDNILLVYPLNNDKFVKQPFSLLIKL